MAYNTELKDKVPPHDEEAERAALGAMMLDAAAVPTAGQFIKPEDFYSTANGKIYHAIRTLYDTGGSKADIITVCEQLKKDGELEAVGGEPYVSSLTNVVPSSANIDHYARIVQDRSLRRALLIAAAQMSSLAYDISEETYQVLEKTQKLIFDLTDRKRTLSYRSLQEIVPQAIENIQKMVLDKKAYTGVPSGFDELDSLTSGFQNSEMIILGARPSVGKTAFALNMAANIVVKEKRPVAFFSLEMPDVTLTTRLITAEAKVDAHSLRTGFISNADSIRLRDAAGVLYDTPLYIVDTSNMQLLDLRTYARKLRAEKNVEIIFIDYIGLIGTDEYFNNVYERVSYISRSLKSLARELNIPIVVLSQVARAAEKEEPTLASLRDSGAVEQDADVVMFLHRDRKNEKNQDPNAPPPETQEIKLIIAKNRNGPIGDLNLLFRSKFTQFLPKAKERS
jgi:replicative DNA helicase